MIPLAVIRPQPGCDATVAAARDLGLQAHGFPLFAVRGLAWEPPAPGNFDAVLIGSANALRHGGAALATVQGKPAYAVGKATAEAARLAGLDVIATGEGGLQAVLDTVRPEHARLLRLAGRERVELAPSAGISLMERVVYASEPLPLPAGLAGLLARRTVVLLHSGEAARHFAGLCDTRAIDRARIALVTIGPRVTEAAGSGWGALETAAAPGDHALLALAQRMCEEQDRL